jgi:hypothetical protein
MTMQQQALPLNGMARPDTGHYRGDHLLVAADGGARLEGARRRLRRRRSFAAAGSRGIDGRGIELSREGVNRCVAKGLAVVQGDADTDLDQLSRRRLRLCDPVADPAGDAAAARGAGEPAADRAARHRLVPEFRLLEDAAAAAGRRPHAAHRKSAGDLVRHAEHPFSAPSRISCSCATRSTSRWSARSRSIIYGRPLRLNAPWWFWNMFGEQGVFLLSRAEVVAMSLLWW